MRILDVEQSSAERIFHRFVMNEYGNEGEIIVQLYEIIVQFSILPIVRLYFFIFRMRATRLIPRISAAAV